MRFTNFRNHFNGRRTTVVLALALFGVCVLGWQWRAQASAGAGAGCPTITFSFNMLPTLTVGAPVNINFAAQGGFPPHKYSLIGSLPAGLSLAVNGTLSGTPTQTGIFNFTVVAADAKGCKGAQPYKLTVKGCPILNIQPGLLPSTHVNTAYNATITASGHVAPYTFLLTAGALPAGISLSSSGALSGTPTQAGKFNFSVTAVSATGCKGTRGYSIQILPVLIPQSLR